MNRLSSNWGIFNENKKTYNEALDRSGFKQKLTYQKSLDNNISGKPKYRKRKIIWFNPLLCKPSNINIGK